MIVNRENLKHIDNTKCLLPTEETFLLPEKVLQFGTGVLLRGLPDYFIDKANKRGVFNGRVVVLKSTQKGDTADFKNQDGLYTICVRGIEKGKVIQENIISSAISRVLTAEKDWLSVLELAKSRDLSIIISNTTEAGIQLQEESITAGVPVSFPAKLLAVLFERFKFLGPAAAELVIIATELIPDNGKKLEAIVYELAVYNQLGDDFITWSKVNHIFCNSLVDRIVPGKPDSVSLTELTASLGYEDQLLILTEPYRLWAIEAEEKVAEILSFKQVDENVIVQPDINIYRELKLRLLNGTHTLTSGIACLSGIETVKDAMSNENVFRYLDQLMFNEIIPAIPYRVSVDEAMLFAAAVKDRFANPAINHLWINITAQYTMKMKIRVLPVLLNYYGLFNAIPPLITFGFAAFLRFMRPIQLDKGAYYGEINGLPYIINDDYAPYFYKISALSDERLYVRNVLADKVLWATSLDEISGFIDAVENAYFAIGNKGINAALADLD